MPSHPRFAPRISRESTRPEAAPCPAWAGTRPSERSIRPRTIVLVSALLLLGCGEARPEPRPRGAFEIHEWGLFGLDNSSSQLSVGSSGVPTPGFTGYGPTVWGSRPVTSGKPVIYVHLDEGVNEARFDLALGIPSAALLERWPTPHALAESTRVGWRGVVARRGPCTQETQTPFYDSPECTGVHDGFCEAVELPRYSGGRASCLSVGPSTSEVLFYRAHVTRAPALPVMLVREGSHLFAQRTGNVEGMVFYIEKHDSASREKIRLLGDHEYGRELTTLEGRDLTPLEVRTACTTYAVTLGLTSLEAEALVDAWAPLFFDTRRREGLEAFGTPPPAFEAAGRTLLYFAPRSVIDAALPLETDPPARAVVRVFLVRIVDASSREQSGVPL